MHPTVWMGALPLAHWTEDPWKLCLVALHRIKVCVSPRNSESRDHSLDSCMLGQLSASLAPHRERAMTLSV